MCITVQPIGFLVFSQSSSHIQRSLFFLIVCLTNLDQFLTDPRQCAQMLVRLWNKRHSGLPLLLLLGVVKLCQISEYRALRWCRSLPFFSPPPFQLPSLFSRQSVMLDPSHYSAKPFIRFQHPNVRYVISSS